MNANRRRVVVTGGRDDPAQHVLQERPAGALGGLELR